MLKYFLSLLVVLQLCSFADEGEEKKIEEPEYTKCEIAFDKCVSKCDETSEKYAACYDACEANYQKCVDGGAKAE